MKMDFSTFSVELPFMLALTPALGLKSRFRIGTGERVSSVTTPDNFSILVTVTDSVSFTNKTHDNPSYHFAQNAANDSPSPGGEGRGEGGRHH